MSAAAWLQVRSVGKTNPLTRQPIKGRKVGGGIRFGEMERDSLLAHGAAYLLHDRLHYCSDYNVVDVCASCGSMLALKHRKDASNVILDKRSTVVMVGRRPRRRSAWHVGATGVASSAWPCRGCSSTS